MLKFESLCIIFLAIFLSGVTYGGDLIIYPAKGQSAEQQDRDRYECHRWAVDQTGFDPSNPSSAASSGSSAQRQREPILGRGSQPNAVRGGARGAALGAVGGAIAGDAGKGAAVGAGVGALGGAIRRRDRQSDASRSNAPPTTSTTASSAYNRAMSACLTGRGYSVK